MISFSPRRFSAFSLIELLVTIAVFALLSAMLVGVVTQTNKALSHSAASLQGFRESRLAFEAIKHAVSQATINSYWAYDPPPPATPLQYVRQSELHFISGAGKELLGGAQLGGSPQSKVVTHGLFFQAPLGFSRHANENPPVPASALHATLNAVGFVAAFDDDAAYQPAFAFGKASPRHRYRLYQWLQPTQDLAVYTEVMGRNWFRLPLTTGRASLSPLSQNILALVVLPQSKAAGSGDYDLVKSVTETWGSSPYNFDTREGTYDDPGRNALPESVRIVIAAIDEASATRLHGESTQPPLDLEALGLFQNLRLDEDLDALRDILEAKAGNLAANTIPLNYQIFDATVDLHESD
jgi:uncharacterized protein (TIGR02599 family)